MELPRKFFKRKKSAGMSSFALLLTGMQNGWLKPQFKDGFLGKGGRNRKMKDKVSVPDDNQDATLTRDCHPLSSFNERNTKSSYQLCAVEH